jgi:hypothetical protein
MGTAWARHAMCESAFNVTSYSESTTDPIIPLSDQHPLPSDALQLLSNRHWPIVWNLEHNVRALAAALLAATM